MTAEDAGRLQHPREKCTIHRRDRAVGAGRFPDAILLLERGHGMHPGGKGVDRPGTERVYLQS